MEFKCCATKERRKDKQDTYGMHMLRWICGIIMNRREINMLEVIYIWLKYKRK